MTELIAGLSKNKIAVIAKTSENSAAAHVLAEFLDIPVIDQSLNAHHFYDYLLICTADYLSIVALSKKKQKPFFIDFSSTANLFRLKKISRRNESLAKALGAAPKANLKIIDATAGLGRDSFILAALGYDVIMIERSPILYVLLADALARAEKMSHLKPIVNRLNLIHADAIDWLKELDDASKPDIIYLDPMFPERKKKLLVKKEMIMMQQLIGKDGDALELFNMALTCARRRVVIKRPRLAENMGSPPHFSLVGKASRFDVYVKL